MQTLQDMACDLLEGVYEDILRWDRSHQSDVLCKKDLHYLQKRIRTRGIGEVLDVLPSFGKCVDTWISQGYGTSHDVPKSFPKFATGMPNIFLPLLLKVFDVQEDRSTWSMLYDPDPNAIFFLRQLTMMWKKVKHECTDAVKRKAQEDYFLLDSSLRKPTMSWDGFSEVFEFEGRRDSALCRPTFVSALIADQEKGESRVPFQDGFRALDTLDRVCRHVGAMFPDFNPEDILPDHGPGAVADMKANENKFSFPTWPKGLEYHFPQDRFAYPSEEWAHVVGGDIPNAENSSRVIQVPKTITKPRMITVETVSRQFIQQGLLRWMREHFPHPVTVSYSPRSQEPSRARALEASVTLSDATVDLSEASDRLTCWSVERFLHPTGLLPYLHAARTPHVVDELFGFNGSNPYYLRKFAGQGSAVTFPVQSYCYYLASIAAVIATNDREHGFRNPRLTNRIIRAASRKVRVFGDDIIIPKDALHYLDIILQFNELKINVGKTHYQGRFRESCGMDAWNGHDVTPVYLSLLRPGKRPSDLASWIDVSNNAHSAGLWCLANKMDRALPRKTLKLLPASSEPQGVLTRRTYTSGIDPSAVTFADGKYQSPEVLGLIPKSRSRRRTGEGYHELHRFFCDAGKTGLSNPVNFHSWKSGYVVDSFTSLRKGRVPLR